MSGDQIRWSGSHTGVGVTAGELDLTQVWVSQRVNWISHRCGCHSGCTGSQTGVGVIADELDLTHVWVSQRVNSISHRCGCHSGCTESHTCVGVTAGTLDELTLVVPALHS